MSKEKPPETNEQVHEANSPDRSGDTIHAQIGDGVRGVAVGKNIIQIGTLKLPYWVVALLLLMLLAILAFVAVPPILTALTPAPPPEPMKGKFNIAVTQFGELDADGRVSPSDDGARLSEWVTAKLTDEFEANKELFGSGDMIELRLIDADFDDDSIESGTLKGATAEERKAGAEALAAQIRAGMVIYGNLTASDDTKADGDKQLLLEFYLAPSFGGEAQQVVGHDRLGDPLPVSRSLDGLGAFASAGPLETRAQALAGLTISLIYDLLGDHEQARKSLAALEADLPNWRDDEGKELLYFLMARQQLFLDQDDAAEVSAQKALAARPGYSRAHIVLGSVFTKRAEASMAETLALARENSAKALAEYEAAVDGAEAEGNQLVAQIAHLALASAYTLEGQVAYLAKESEAANAALDRALTELDGVYSPLEASGQFRYLAQAYQFAGNAYFLKAAISSDDNDLVSRQGNLQAAQDAYSRCIEQGTRTREDNTLQERLIDRYCQPMLNSTVDELKKAETTS